MNWINLLSNLGIFSITSGLMAWLIKSLGESYFKRKFAAYEKELEIKSDEFKLEIEKKIERYKYELDFMKLKDARVYEKQISITEKLYEKIIHLQTSLLEMTALFKTVRENFDEEETERIERAGKAYNDFLLFYKPNKIYFKNETTKLLDAIMAGSYDTIDDYIFWKKWGMKGSDIAFQKIEEASERMRREIPEILAKLEEDFRELIGVQFK